MNNYELYLEPVRDRKSNGQFVKGNIPHNKGKKWNDFVPLEKQEKCKKGLLLGRILGNKNIAGWNSRKIVGIDENGRWCVFDSSRDAARKVQGCDDALIRRCCREKGIHHHRGIKWFFENDPKWYKEIKKEEHP